MHCGEWQIQETFSTKVNTMNQFFFSITAFAMISSAAFAQPNIQTMSGTFILAEEGSGVSQPIASIAILNFASGGTVAGVQVQRSPGSTIKLSAIGTYALNNDGTGTLALTLQTMPADGSEPVVGTANYHLRWSKSEIGHRIVYQTAWPDCLWNR